jgi:hypothetical protein
LIGDFSHIDRYIIHIHIYTYSRQVSTALYQGGGVSDILVEAGMAYCIGGPISEVYAHATGPAWPLSALALKRKLLIMPGYFEDEATTRERPLLLGKSYASEFYHYKEDGSGKTVYDNWEPEIEDRIDTQCAEVPDIPAGYLSQTSLGL